MIAAGRILLSRRCGDRFLIDCGRGTRPGGAIGAEVVEHEQSFFQRDHVVNVIVFEDEPPDTETVVDYSHGSHSRLFAARI